MCCQKASCASVATACCQTASANNCCPWHARCSPNRVENHDFFRACLIAHRGTAPLRKSHARRRTLRPCATLFRRLRYFMTTLTNPRRRLAPRTSEHQCALCIQNSLSAISRCIPKRPDRTACVHPSTRCHHDQRKNCTIGSLSEILNTIQYRFWTHLVILKIVMTVQVGIYS